jgi:hypothetical protein
MARTVGSIVAGLLIFFALAFIAGVAAHSLWPDYAAAATDRAYTVPMLLARLLIGAVATIVAGWGTSMIARERQTSALWLGLAMLAINVPWHIHIWSEYPAWYHLVWLACLIPCALLGGRIARVEGMRR